MPQVWERLQKLDNARAMLVVNGVLTKAQSEAVRRKIMKKVENKA